MQICGREFSDEVLQRIRERVQTDDALTRTALSREVGSWLDWRDAKGRVSAMSCRVALRKLDRQGVIALPAARPITFLRADAPDVAAMPVGAAVVASTLSALGSVELVPVDSPARSRQWRAAMQAHHPLGAGPLCGAQLRYLVTSPAGLLGALSFSAPAWRLAARDAFIGWDDATRAARLSRVVNNSRFLILPTVQVPNLASHVLSLATARLPGDWQARYGVTPRLLETFVDTSRYRGTCYRAANWLALGVSSGRGRQDREHRANGTPKAIFVYPLCRDWRAHLLSDALPVTQATAADWAEHEFGQARLPDARLRSRLLTLTRDFFARPMANLPQACGSRARTKAAYRFFDHHKITMNTLLESHYRATEARVCREPVILAVQDTTSLNYTSHAATTGMGPIGTKADGPQGLHLHSTMTFTPQGTPLGYIDTQCWARDPADFGKKARRAQLPITQKESHKWLTSYRAATALQARCRKTRVVSVGDREADIYELFEEATRDPANAHVLIRAEHNRALLDEQARLWPTLQALPVAGVQELHVPRQGSRKARDASLEIRFAKVALCAPKRKAGRSIPVWAVLAQEKDVAEGVKPLAWMLLTTVPVETLTDAVEKLQWYARRWGIEVLFRTLKSGCRIEDRQLGTADRLESCLAIDLVVAWRIYHLKQLGHVVPQAPCTVCFEDPQWKALMVFTDRNAVPPKEPPTLREALRRTAGLGGFLGRKSDGEPGNETLWRGLQRLDDIAEIWQVMRDATQRRVSSRRDSG